ncbi:hypothetical protein BpHYR1_033399 [Brachionus plicatilis]|uniref:Uncharacterized protein n=1 Tax=Brachionus plicatilis TaxID=10195 RepID=A0A3M7Q161_BRAPC|nr:hypothetical protein BpHYR1_033399 [Brachionus plicatilis]
MLELLFGLNKIINKKYQKKYCNMQHTLLKKLQPRMLHFIIFIELKKLCLKFNKYCQNNPKSHFCNYMSWDSKKFYIQDFWFHHIRCLNNYCIGLCLCHNKIQKGIHTWPINTLSYCIENFHIPADEQTSEIYQKSDYRIFLSGHRSIASKSFVPQISDEVLQKKSESEQAQSPFEQNKFFEGSQMTKFDILAERLYLNHRTIDFKVFIINNVLNGFSSMLNYFEIEKEKAKNNKLKIKTLLNLKTTKLELEVLVI